MLPGIVGPAGVLDGVETVGAGLLFAGSKAWSLEGVYDYQWNVTGYQDNQAKVKFVIHL